MPSPRNSTTTTDYLDGHDSSGGESGRGKSAQPRGYSPKLHRGISDTSLIRRGKKAEDTDNHDSQFESDTDYDPRDKYYLSAEEDAPDPPPSERRGSVRHQSDIDRKSHSRHGSSQPGLSLSSGHRRSRAHGHSHEHHHRSSRHSHSHSHSRDYEADHTDRHNKPSSFYSKPASQASRPRPGPSRASSSYLSAARRPRVNRAGSSYAASRARPRPRPARSLSHNNRQAKPKHKKMPWENFPWEDAAKVAIQAGGVALMKLGAEQMPWTVKGTKIASAALGAAVVDHVLKPKKRGGVKYAAMRHLAEVAVGSMVVSPAIGRMSGGGRKK